MNSCKITTITNVGQREMSMLRSLAELVEMQNNDENIDLMKKTIIRGQIRNFTLNRT